MFAVRREFSCFSLFTYAIVDESRRRIHGLATARNNAERDDRTELSSRLCSLLTGNYAQNGGRRGPHDEIATLYWRDRRATIDYIRGVETFSL